MGNLASVYNAFKKTGCNEVKITADPKELEAADKLVLPGVGAFEDAMKNLNQSGQADVIKAAVKQGKPLLGVCLGFQLIFEKSYENGEWQGLGLLPGIVRRFEIEEPVPHMGWNQASFKASDSVFRHIQGQEVYFYFDHAYYVEPGEPGIVAADTEYGDVIFCSAASRDNIYATQFHPEKSHDQGLAIIEKFAGL